MSRLIAPANVTAGVRNRPAGSEMAAVRYSIDQLLGGAKVDGADVVIVADTAPDPLDVFVAPHRHADGLVVVSSAPPEVARGQQGAFAGLGRAWSVGVDALVPHLGVAADEADLRWRLWNDGAMVMPIDGAGFEPPSELAWDRLPGSGPVVSWVIHGGPTAPDLDRLDPLLDVPGVENEVIVAERGAEERATAAARGSVVWWIHRSVLPDRRLVARMWRRLSDERIEAVRAALTHAGTLVADAEALDGVDRLLGAPGLAVMRRRVLRKHRHDAAWEAAFALERISVLDYQPPEVTPRRRWFVPRPSVTRTSPAAPSTPEPLPPVDTRPKIGYVGFSGQGNFGDELVLAAVRHLLPDHRIEPGSDNGVGVVLGGGTLLNAEGFYQRIADRITPIGVPRAVFGTGVVSPEVAGWTEQIDGWDWFLRPATVGVRGPHSLSHLRAWGWDGPARVIGDVALAVEPVGDPVPGRVVVAPIGISDVGQIEADDEATQLELLTEAIGRWRADGREVHMLAAYRGDEAIIDGLCRRVGEDLPRVAAHESVDAGLAAIASADFVVGARLHAIVAAASAGVPFMGLAYRPKLADFAASVRAEHLVRPIRRWTPGDLVAAPAASDETDRAVTELRGRLREFAADFAVRIAGTSAP